MEKSEKTTTPPLPRESEIAQSALIVETSLRRVVTLVNNPACGCGPAVASACHPITGIFAAFAAAIASVTVAGSNPPMTIPSACNVTA